MEFKRKKLRGQNKKVRRTWLSAEGYRIVWRKEVCGVAVPARFQATVRIVIPNYGGVEGVAFQMWDFTDSAHRLFKTLKTAQESCERHRRLWTKASEATGIRSLVEIFGKVPTGFPVWVRKKLSRKVYEVLNRPRVGKYRDEEEEECSSPPVQPEASDTTLTSSAGPSPSSETGPVSPATAVDGSTTRKTRRARSKATDTFDNSPAEPVEAPVKGRKRRAAKPTTKHSKTTVKGKRNTNASSKPAKPRSSGSRKKKSAPSGS